MEGQVNARLNIIENRHSSFFSIR